MKQEMIDRLTQMAKRTCCDEEIDEDEFFNPDDFAGGNIDDAYQGGFDDGETYLAREVLKAIHKSST